MSDYGCRSSRACRRESLQAMARLRPSGTVGWRECLLLTPSIDYLFDRGFISFEKNGRLLVSPVADLRSLGRMGVPVAERRNVGAFTEGQSQYLEFHQERVFLASRVERR